MTPTEALREIISISYTGHPDGRETRLIMITRIAMSALGEGEVSSKVAEAQMQEGGDKKKP